jgi:LysR family glycine cleavage system transcriptional activator
MHRLMLPSPYFLAWRPGVFDKHGARNFHRWLIGMARRQESQIGCAMREER